MNRFIKYKSMILEKKGKYPFMIANTDSSDKDGKHFFNILDIGPETVLFFSIHLVLMVSKVLSTRVRKE